MDGAQAEALRRAGVTVLDAATSFVEEGVQLSPGVIIHPGVTLEGNTVVGPGSRIRSWVRISNAVIGSGVVVNDCCVISDSRVDDGASVGPFAHIRPESHVMADARVGNFVELKKTRIGVGSKASHLTYLGDATIGNDVNIGAGTITCNYDGIRKNSTVIEDGAFIGSDSQLIAPVRVGAGAFVAAGSSITKDVPAGSLGIARARQRIVEGWVGRKKRL